MGKPSDKWRSAQRQSRRRRARVKRLWHRTHGTSFVSRDGTTAEMFAGRKKRMEAIVSRNPANIWGRNYTPHLVGVPVGIANDLESRAASLDGVTTDAVAQPDRNSP